MRLRPQGCIPFDVVAPAAVITSYSELSRCGEDSTKDTIRSYQREHVNLAVSFALPTHECISIHLSSFPCQARCSRLPRPQNPFAHGTAKIHARSEDTGMSDEHKGREGVGDGGRIGFGEKQDERTQHGINEVHDGRRQVRIE